MTPEEAKKRVTFIERMQAKLEKIVVKMGSSLLSVIKPSAKAIIEDPKVLESAFTAFNEEFHLPVIKTFAEDFEIISDLNADYFKEAEVSKNILSRVKGNVDAYFRKRIGYDIRKGELILSKDSFLESLYRADPVKQDLRTLAYNASQSNTGVKYFEKQLEVAIKGIDTPQGKSAGVLERYYRTYAYDTYQQSDRAAQTTYSEEIGLTAFIYTGGLIKSSRPFCVARNGKVILKSEAELWGTSKDPLGGYSNKSQGLFAGKPKGGYIPLQDMGGYECRHSPSFISNREALRRRSDLEVIDGQLTIKKDAE